MQGTSEILPKEILPAVSDDDSNEILLEMVRDIVRRSPLQCIAWAQSQTNSILRERLLFAVLRAWGETNPRAAVQWAGSQDEDERQLRMEAALTGAVAQPEVALQIGRDLVAADPETGGAYGMTLIASLSRESEFNEALEFLKDAPEESRADWAGAMFQLWGQSKPEDAVKALESLADDVQGKAFDALVSGWAVTSPDTLADYAMKLPSKEERAQALGAAVDSWCLRDPVGMSEWMNDLPQSPALDEATALMVKRTDSLERVPEVAMSWVAGITDAELRRESLQHVVHEWAQTDAAAAKKYIEAAPWIDAGQRQEILQSFSTTP
jgi:hypothetical protein